MEIESVDDLIRASREAGELLQRIQDYCESIGLNWAQCKEARVRFPRGFIRPARLQRSRVPFVRDQALKDNIAYTLILSDTVLWLMLRTDLWGVPREMLTKLYVFLIAAVCESITKDYLLGVCGKSFKRRNEYLLSQGIIDPELKDDLDWLWDTRNRMHLFKLKEREYRSDYTDECHERCVRTFRALLAALKARGRIA